MAELCAAFLCAEVGIDQTVVENQTAYIRDWLEKLQAEPQAFVTPAARAEKAADYILRRQAAKGDAVGHRSCAGPSGRKDTRINP